jgi:hypothetical protein
MEFIMRGQINGPSVLLVPERYEMAAALSILACQQPVK